MTTPAHRSPPNTVTPVGSANVAPPPASTLLHGTTLRPPAMSWDGKAYTGSRLVQLELDNARTTPGVVDIVVRSNFIGIIASQPRQALQAKALLQPGWASPVAATQAAPSLKGPATGSKAPAHTAANTSDSVGFSQTYLWPGEEISDTPWAIAHYTGEALSIWVHTGHSERLRAELALLCALPDDAVHIISHSGKGTEGYDMAADAALLSKACSKPVRVQQLAKAANTIPTSLHIQSLPESSPPNTPHTNAPTLPLKGISLSANRTPGQRPSIAALLCGLESSHPPAIRVQAAHYAREAAHQPLNSLIPIDTSITGLPTGAQIFARESAFDEICRAQDADPIQARLATLADPTGHALITSVAKRANWSGAETSARPKPYQGRGFAYAHIIDQTQEPPQAVWSAWVAEIRVDPASGTIDLTGLTVGHHTDTLHNSANTGPEFRIEDEVRRAAVRCLPDNTRFDSWGDTPSAENELALAANTTQIKLVNQGPTGLAWSQSAELPAAAAIANAIYDATGVRLRKAPFSAQELKAQLALSRGSSAYKKTGYALLGALAAGIGGLLLSAMPWRSAIAPVTHIDPSIYSAAALERGRLVAAAGDCLVCHTAENGIPNAGGLALDTPFGTIYTTNITPDRETGIGNWSFTAFDRAMRQGIHRDGRHLYPAFPYTAFAKMSDADMQALYAWLMMQEPVKNTVPATQLAFPYNARPLLAGWNALFHKNEQYQPDPSQSTLWNRGAYLVQGMGHCAACHSPRNALGAEKSGSEHFLAGGFAEGWEAPALTALSKAPIPWTEDELYHYMRTGYSALHGVASGPMAPVVQSMAALPDQDVRAIAHYLGTLAAPQAPGSNPSLLAAQLEERSRNDQRVMSLAGENLFQGACAVCHDAREGPPLFGSRPSLALNSNLHSNSPDNVIQILLHGIDNPAMSELGYMPGFGASMNDQQLQTLLEYLRMRFAPDKPAWQGLAEKIQALR